MSDEGDVFRDRVGSTIGDNFDLLTKNDNGAELLAGLLWATYVRDAWDFGQVAFGLAMAVHAAADTYLEMKGYSLEDYGPYAMEFRVVHVTSEGVSDGADEGTPMFYAMQMVIAVGENDPQSTIDALDKAIHEGQDFCAEMTRCMATLLREVVKGAIVAKFENRPKGD